MGLWDIIRHPRRYKDLWDAFNALKRNWRTPDMGKLKQREFWMPLFTALLLMANDAFDLGMSEQTMAWAAGLCVTAVIGLLARKKIMGTTEGPK